MLGLPLVEFGREDLFVVVVAEQRLGAVGELFLPLLIWTGWT